MELFNKVSRYDKNMMNKTTFNDIRICENPFFKKSRLRCIIYQLQFVKNSIEKRCNDFYYGFDVSYDSEKKKCFLDIVISGENEKTTQAIAKIQYELDVNSAMDDRDIQVKDILTHGPFRLKIERIISLTRKLMNYQIGNIEEKTEYGCVKYESLQMVSLSLRMTHGMGKEDLKNQNLLTVKEHISQNGFTGIDDYYIYSPNKTEEKRAIFDVQGFGYYQTNVHELKLPNQMLGKRLSDELKKCVELLKDYILKNDE